MCTMTWWRQNWHTMVTSSRALYNQLWWHNQGVNRPRGAWCWYVKSVFFIVICGLIISRKKTPICLTVLRLTVNIEVELAQYRDSTAKVMAAWVAMSSTHVVSNTQHDDVLFYCESGSQQSVKCQCRVTSRKPYILFAVLWMCNASLHSTAYIYTVLYFQSDRICWPQWQPSAEDHVKIVKFFEMMCSGSCIIQCLGPPLQTWINLIPAWISNHMANKVLDQITYPFLNFNGCMVLNSYYDRYPGLDHYDAIYHISCYGKPCFEKFPLFKQQFGPCSFQH